jgi:hypothetical protein
VPPLPLLLPQPLMPLLRPASSAMPWQTPPRAPCATKRNPRSTDLQRYMPFANIDGTCGVGSGGGGREARGER